MVEIFIGKSKQRFHVHKRLLGDKIPYFKNMFESGFQESIDQTATLPEDDPEVFALFIQWIYGNAFKKPTNVTEDSPSTFRLVQVYAFAEKISLPILMDYTMTYIISRFVKNKIMPSIDTVCEAYRTTHQDSKLRLFGSRYLSFAILRGKKGGIRSQITAETMNCQDLTRDVMEHLLGSHGKPLESPLAMKKMQIPRA